MSRFESALTALIANLSDRDRRLLSDRFGLDVSSASNSEILEAMSKLRQAEEDAHDEPG